MMKLFRFYIIYRFSKDAITAAKIYNMLYHTNVPLHKSEDQKKPNEVKPKSEKTINKTQDKKQQIIESLEYLKSKKNPTKQDKDSIYTLQMVLKNM